MKRFLFLAAPFLLLAGVIPAIGLDEAPMPRSKSNSSKLVNLRQAPAKPPAAPTLTAPASVEVEAGDLFTISAQTSGKWVGFWPADGGLNQFHFEELFEGAKPKVGAYVGRVDKNATPGTVYRIFIYAGNDTAAATPVVCSVVVKGIPPAPAPIPPGPPVPGPIPPNPIPPIPPNPNQQVSYFVVVEDTLKAGAWRGDVLGSAKVASAYKSLQGGRTGAIHRLVDINTPVAAQDALAKFFIAKANGKALPYLFTLDSTGGEIKEQQCPTDADAFVVALNVPAPQKSFGLIPAKKKMAWTKFGTTPNTPLIDRSQWKPMTLAAFLPPVYDQDGRGQCVASSTSTTLEACRKQLGLTPMHLSAGDLYSNINGGRDNGATLEDSMAWITTHGVTTVTNVPYVWNGRRYSTAAIVADRKNYMAVEVYLCPSFDAAGSALQQGFFLVEALTWYNSYMQPGADGWLPGPGRGVAGGHALCGYGLAQKGGVWGIRTRNSWNTSFGGSNDGTVGAGDCVIPEGNFDDIPSNGFFAIRAVVQTPTSLPFKTSKLIGNRGEFALGW